MTIVQQDHEAPAPVTAIDPFTLPAPAQAPRRPRLLSHVGRWGRARRWLPADAVRVLDVGCAFGYGSAAIAAPGPADRIVVGVERDPEHLEEGRRRFPWVRIIEADAAALPFPDGCADAVVLLDVIEHLAEPDRALAEAYRVLRPGGLVVVSVPHSGALRRLDALNVYQALRRRRPSWPPPEAATESGSGTHRHFAAHELEELMRARFTVDRVARTGLGLQELVFLLLLLIRAALHAERVYRALLPLHLAVYLADDLVPMGRLAYHLTVRGRTVCAGGTS
jgi:SAM-dependent methyltransferase